MRYVIRKGSLCTNLFLTPAHRWGRLAKARIFTEMQVGKVADKLSARNFGVFDLSHARNMVASGYFRVKRTEERLTQGDENGRSFSR
jgi:hypothetical protein